MVALLSRRDLAADLVDKVVVAAAPKLARLGLGARAAALDGLNLHASSLSSEALFAVEDPAVFRHLLLVTLGAHDLSGAHSWRVAAALRESGGPVAPAVRLLDGRLVQGLGPMVLFELVGVKNKALVAGAAQRLLRDSVLEAHAELSAGPVSVARWEAMAEIAVRLKLPYLTCRLLRCAPRSNSWSPILVSESWHAREQLIGALAVADPLLAALLSGATLQGEQLADAARVVAAASDAELLAALDALLAVSERGWQLTLTVATPVLAAAGRFDSVVLSRLSAADLRQVLFSEKQASVTCAALGNWLMSRSADPAWWETLLQLADGPVPLADAVAACSVVAG